MSDTWQFIALLVGAGLFGAFLVNPIADRFNEFVAVLVALTVIVPLAIWVVA